jgi:hypothetical protein
MKKQVDISQLLEDCFEHLGVEVSYCNNKREEICKVRALIKRPCILKKTSNILSLSIRWRRKEL